MSSNQFMFSDISFDKVAKSIISLIRSLDTIEVE